MTWYKMKFTFERSLVSVVYAHAEDELDALSKARMSPEYQLIWNLYGNVAPGIMYEMEKIGNV